MTDIILERIWERPRTRSEIAKMSVPDVCFELHRVRRLAALISTDAKRMVCHLKGPDADSCRMALRRKTADVRTLWRGTVHDAPGTSGLDFHSANVLVARRFEAPTSVETVQALEDRYIECLERLRVRFLRTYLSTDRRRMICLYRAPDADSVRRAQRESGMPVESVWAFTRLVPVALLGTKPRVLPR